jgi:UDP-N-acetylmuramyl pentapeptide synthase
VCGADSRAAQQQITKQRDSDVIDRADLRQISGFTRISGADTAFTKMVINSRDAEPGALFVAIRGRRGGHDFIPDAIQRSATK